MKRLAFLMLLVASGQAVAHSWYDSFCCNGDDCRPVDDPSEVRALPDGYHFRQWVIPYKDARISGDSGYHWCELPKGTMRCFYAPPGGF